MTVRVRMTATTGRARRAGSASGACALLERATVGMMQAERARAIPECDIMVPPDQTLALRAQSIRFPCLRQHPFGEVQALLQLAQLLPEPAHIGFEGLEPGLNLDLGPAATLPQAPSRAATSADADSGRVARSRAILTTANATIATMGMSGTRKSGFMSPSS